MRHDWVGEWQSLTASEQTMVHSRLFGVGRHEAAGLGLLLRAVLSGRVDIDTEALRRVVDEVVALRRPKQYIMELRVPKEGERYLSSNQVIKVAAGDWAALAVPVIVGEQ